MYATHWGGPGEDYRLKKISSVNINEVNGISAPAPDDAAPVWQTPKALHSFPWFEVLMMTVGSIGLLGLVVFWLSPASSGIASLAKTTLLAVVPLSIVLSFILFIDRWGPEPWKTKGALFLWGAGVATLSSGILNTALEENIILSTGDLQQSQALGASFIAPLVEETLKGLGVLIVVVVRRTSINSVIDGVVYAGFSAGGFMFAEDILYFVRLDNPEAGGVLCHTRPGEPLRARDGHLNDRHRPRPGAHEIQTRLVQDRRCAGVLVFRDGRPLRMERYRNVLGAVLLPPVCTRGGASLPRMGSHAHYPVSQGGGEDSRWTRALRAYRVAHSRRGHDGHR